MRRAALVIFGVAFLLCGRARADDAASIAVLPYLTVGISDSDAAAISEVLAREIAARTGAKVKAGEQVKGKLPPLPDGCPTEKSCVDSVAKTLSVDRILFAVYLEGSSSNIEVTLSYVGGADDRQAKFTLESDPSSWNDAIRAGLAPVLPATPRGGGEPKTPFYKHWWFFGGAGAVIVGVASFFLLQPSLGFAN